MVLLFLAYVALGAVPSVATVGLCAFVPCDRFPENTAAFTVAENGEVAIVVPECLGVVKTIRVESAPQDSDRAT